MPSNSLNTVIGWDIGGAHVKAVMLAVDGSLLKIRQIACPLWQGISKLEEVIAEILTEPGAQESTHAVTMTGELADVFESRHQGVVALANVMKKALPKQDMRFYAGKTGFLSYPDLEKYTDQIASANWHASASIAASDVNEGLFIDVGSTTTDLICLADGKAQTRGYSDRDRLQFDELIYTGIVRTPLMVLAQRVPFAGEWHTLMAEHFATTADIYRIIGLLPEHADLMPAADMGEKSLAGCVRRLARMIGADANDADFSSWQKLAGYLAECQLITLYRACQRNLSRGLLSDDAPLVGAGVCRYLVRVLANRLRREYLDFGSFFQQTDYSDSLDAADCAAAVSVAALLYSEIASEPVGL